MAPRANDFGTRTGNHITIEMDGKVIGLIQNLRGSDDYGLEPVSGVGSPKVKEYVVSVGRHTVSCGLVAIRSSELVTQGVAPEDVTAALEGLMFDIVVYDVRDSNNNTNATPLKRYIDCSYGSGDFAVDAHRAVSRNATFMALDVAGPL